MAYERLEPTEALTLVLVNKVVPAVVTRTSENTLIESSPKTIQEIVSSNQLLNIAMQG